METSAVERFLGVLLRAREALMRTIVESYTRQLSQYECYIERDGALAKQANERVRDQSWRRALYRELIDAAREIDVMSLTPEEYAQLGMLRVQLDEEGFVIGRILPYMLMPAIAERDDVFLRLYIPEAAMSLQSSSGRASSFAKARALGSISLSTPANRHQTGTVLHACTFASTLSRMGWAFVDQHLPSDISAHGYIELSTELLPPARLVGTDFGEVVYKYYMGPDVSGGLYSLDTPTPAYLPIAVAEAMARGDAVHEDAQMLVRMPGIMYMKGYTADRVVYLPVQIAPLYSTGMSKVALVGV